jgi:glycosyltransferase involved in cell wall biosynthesis
MGNFVSIIIPTYNEEKNLENTLKAIRNQDYRNYEIIVSDSKSKDKTRKIARKYGAKVVVDEKRGMGAGRNLGAKFARGVILVFIDADTVMMTNTLSEIVESFSNKKVFGVTCPVIPSKPTMKNMAIYLGYNSLVKASIKSGKPHVGGMCVAYRKKCFIDAGGFDEVLQAYEDVSTSLRISKFGRIIFNENTFVLTSPRRIEEWGHFRTVLKHTRLYLRFIGGKGIKLKEYEPIR